MRLVLTSYLRNSKTNDFDLKKKKEEQNEENNKGRKYDIFDS
jgi:hypothetical protein